MKRKRIFVMTVLLTLCLVGCAGNDIREEIPKNKEKVQGSETTESTALPENELSEADELSDVDSVSFSFGHLNATEGKMLRFVYDKEYIEVPFYFQGGKKVKQDVGFMVFIDGILQKYSVKEDADRTEDTMHLFTMERTDKQEFTILVKPNTGKKGEKVGIYVCSIVNPLFQPKSEKAPSYQFYGRLGHVNPQQILFKKSVSNPSIHFTKSKDGMDISEEIINAIKRYSVKTVEESLEDLVYVSLFQKNFNETVMRAENGKIHLRLRLYGGVEGRYCTTVFVNNKPVQIDGKDAVESVLQANKMSEYEFTLDVSKYSRLNTIYAVTAPADDAYLDVIRTCEKSDSKLLIND